MLWSAKLPKIFKLKGNSSGTNLRLKVTLPRNTNVFD